ncbi:hypothetical protein TPE_2655 [Treponema pedis str. T A4]|uniref:Uncharacterized protein n=1 Tax=Treponema pedis str. T A4 TaxID=1291379 RepID=S5ZR29_9SPIR|nr:hypothetical protein TPE_2655 [Treponema pedis str. T A4]
MFCTVLKKQLDIFDFLCHREDKKQTDIFPFLSTFYVFLCIIYLNR